MPDYNKYHDIPAEGLAGAGAARAAPVSMVTGATGALGRATALALAAQGHRLVLLCRDADRGRAVAQEVRGASPAEFAEVIIADLERPSSIRSAVDDFHTRHDRLNILVNNAAVYHRDRRITPEGFESMFATNYLGPYLLTRLLAADLRRGAPSCVLNVTAPSTTRLSFNDLQSQDRFGSLRAFGASKMADLLFTYELARRWQDSGIAVHAVFPGLVRSNLMHEASALLRGLTRLFSSAPQKAAAGVAALAGRRGQEEPTGGFYRGERRISSNSYSRDPQVQARLWELTESTLGPLPTL
jgi:retinol dehydrogenase-13